jgi:hypothetical protein
LDGGQWETKKLDGLKNTAANKMFLQWCGDVLPKVYIFVQRFVSGTGRGFGIAPLKKHKRWQQYLHDKWDYLIGFQKGKRTMSTSDNFQSLLVTID